MNRMIALFEEDIKDQLSFDELVSEGYDDIIDIIDDRPVEKKVHLFENSETVTDKYNETDDPFMDEEFDEDEIIDYVNTDATEG